MGRALGGGLSSDSRDVALSQVRVAIRVDRRITYVQPSAHGFTLTRLRYRYGTRSPATDLVFRAAPPITGGTGEPDEAGHLTSGVRRTAAESYFQARYAILHRRRERPDGQCRHWQHGGWAGPPDGRQLRGTARALAPTSGSVRLEQLIRTPVPDLRLRSGAPSRRARGAGKTGRAK